VAFRCNTFNVRRYTATLAAHHAYSKTLSQLTLPPGLILRIRHNTLQPLLTRPRMIRPLIKRHNPLPLLRHSLRRQLDINREPVSARTLPPRLALPSTTDFVQSARRLRSGDLVRAQRRHEGGDVVRLERLHHLLRHDRPRHGRAGIRRDGVDEDVVFLPLQRKRPRQPENRTLRSRVIRLSEIAINTARAGRVHNTSILLLQEMRPRCLRALERPASVGSHDGVPEVGRHVCEGLVAEDAGVVDEDVYGAEGVDGGFDDGVAFFAAVLGGDGFATCLFDLGDDVVGVHEVVDDDFGAEGGEEETVCASEAVSGLVENL